MPISETLYRLVISCPDRPGIVAAVSHFIAERGGSIVQADQHSEKQTFFMRYEIDAGTFPLSLEAFQEAFKTIAHAFHMQYRISRNTDRNNILIMVSRTAHCLEELLYRWHNQELNVNIVGVISNHNDLCERVRYFKLPFYHVPVRHNDKAKHFDEVNTIIQEINSKTKIHTVVLARYMQVLPHAWCQIWHGKIINIHHSFLPSFAGAHPYRQAAARGVKLIGATAHYVTPALDEGPIIEQNVIRVTHRQTVEDYIRLGKNVERSVLADAVTAHVDDRVILHGDKTIVFN